VIWPRPFQGWLVLRGLGLAWINLPTKFKFLSLSTMKIWKGIQNAKMGWFGVVMGHSKSLKIAPSTYEFLVAFHSNYVHILHRFRGIARYWSKSITFNLPHLHLAPPLEVIPSEFCRDFWHQKTRPLGYYCMALFAWS